MFSFDSNNDEMLKCGSSIALIKHLMSSKTNVKILPQHHYLTWEFSKRKNNNTYRLTPNSRQWMKLSVSC